MNSCIKNVSFNDTNIFRLMLTSFTASVLFSLFSYSPNSHATQSPSISRQGDEKILIVYYTRSGNTQIVAEQIHSLVGGNIVQLETVSPYPDEYRATTKQARQELDDDFHPLLKTQIPNIESYDIIFIGSPIWWGTMSMPVRTFLYDYDLTEKTIVPFVTHEGSGLGNSMRDLNNFAKDSTILSGLAIRGGSANNSNNQIRQWLNNIGVLAN